MHINFTDIVNGIVKSGWGREFESVEEAQKEMLGDLPKLTAYASISLLQRLNKISKAVGDGNNSYKPLDRSIKLADDAATFPDSFVGDRLFHGEMEDGFKEYVILAKDEEHHCLAVQMDNFNLRWPPCSFIATEDMRTSMADAVILASKNDTAYHGKQFKLAQDALKAAESGEDLARFIKGMPND